MLLFYNVYSQFTYYLTTLMDVVCIVGYEGSGVCSGLLNGSCDPDAGVAIKNISQTLEIFLMATPASGSQEPLRRIGLEISQVSPLV